MLPKFLKLFREISSFGFNGVLFLLKTFQLSYETKGWQVIFCQVKLFVFKLFKKCNIHWNSIVTKQLLISIGINCRKNILDYDYWTVRFYWSNKALKRTVSARKIRLKVASKKDKIQQPWSNEYFYIFVWNGNWTGKSISC